MGKMWANNKEILNLLEIQNFLMRMDCLIHSCTVETPNNGHVGEMASVRCRELSASRDWPIILSNHTIYIILMQFYIY